MNVSQKHRLAGSGKPEDPIVVEDSSSDIASEEIEILQTFPTQGRRRGWSYSWEDSNSSEIEVHEVIKVSSDEDESTALFEG